MLRSTIGETPGHHGSRITRLTGSRPIRGLGALILALVIAIPGTMSALAAPAVPASTPIPSFVTAGSYCADWQERAFMKLINDYRASWGYAPLRHSKTLAAAADHHSVDMANRNYFSHTLSDGTTWSQNIINHGYRYGPRGENIAAGSSLASKTFEQWRNSPSHRRNMLNPEFNAIGIGRAINSNSRYDFYWTTTFGGYRDAWVTCSV